MELQFRYDTRRLCVRLQGRRGRQWLPERRRGLRNQRERRHARRRSGQLL